MAEMGLVTLWPWANPDNCLSAAKTITVWGHPSSCRPKSFRATAPVPDLARSCLSWQMKRLPASLLPDCSFLAALPRIAKELAS